MGLRLFYPSPILVLDGGTEEGIEAMAEDGGTAALEEAMAVVGVTEALVAMVVFGITSVLDTALLE